ncbi:tripartite motif-containing protein 2-like [Dysidea avara]|uniref:tripartite motif-containing protein 2-like n=1 Tax=Dysidea avara TaxID=196820 RepID=UPI003318FCA9
MAEENHSKIIEPVATNLSTLHQRALAAREIDLQITKVDQQIDLYYDELHTQLQQQREELKSKLTQISAQSKNVISVQLERIKTQLLGVDQLMADEVKDGSDQETRKQEGKDVQKLADSYNKLNTMSFKSPTVEFAAAKEFQHSFPQFGQLLFDIAIPTNCEIKGMPVQPLVGSKVNLSIITKDRNNDRCSIGGTHIIVQAQSTSREGVVPVEVKDNSDGSYSAPFLPKQPGELKLSITIAGDHIKGSPFAVMVYPNYKAIDKPRKIVDDGGYMGKPWAIAFGQSGIWAVTDQQLKCVRVFDHQDRLFKKIGRGGTGKSQFESPEGIAFDAGNHLYVSDYFNHSIQKFTVNGEHLLQFGCWGSANGELNHPTGIAVHKENLLVAEHLNRRVSVFHLDRRFSHVIGSGYLHKAWDIAVSSNQVLVADNKSNHIFRFTLDGMFIDKFGDGRLDHPAALAVDINGFVFVTENGKHCVTIYDTEGMFLRSFGSRGSDDGQFLHPRGITFSPNHDIYVSDLNNRRIHVFSSSFV